MKQWKLVAGISLVFVLGALVGSAVTGCFLRSGHTPRFRDPVQRKAVIMERLIDRLELDDAQKSQVEAVVDRSDARMQENLRERRAQARRIMEEGFAEIRRVLREDQQKSLDALEAEIDARHRERHRRWFGESPPPE
ncbi:MAG: hypothetical protein ACOWWM_16585 [Desulfobacterales bacterium]